MTFTAGFPSGTVNEDNRGAAHDGFHADGQRELGLRQCNVLRLDVPAGLYSIVFLAFYVQNDARKYYKVVFMTKPTQSADFLATISVGLSQVPPRPLRLEPGQRARVPHRIPRLAQHPLVLVEKARDGDSILAAHALDHRLHRRPDAPLLAQPLPRPLGPRPLLPPLLEDLLDAVRHPGELARPVVNN